LQRLEGTGEIGAHDDPRHNPSGHHSPAVKTMTIPWTSPVPAALKGIIHVPAHNTPMKPSRREALLTAIAKARKWIDDLAYDRGRHEGERGQQSHVPFDLAFAAGDRGETGRAAVSTLLDGTALAHLTLTALARALPYSWAEQERALRGNPWRHHLIGAG